MRWLSQAIVLGAALIAPALAIDDRDDFFEAKIRPILAGHCWKCHGSNEPEAGLRLDSREAILRGGDSGPAAQLGGEGSAESLLVQAIAWNGELRMPPDGKLSDSEIELLTEWVRLGIYWPNSHPSVQAIDEIIVTDADRSHWAFRPIADFTAPPVRDQVWPANNIDRFVLAKLESAGLHPAEPADKPTLIRRAYYDLIGLPPTFEEVQAFVADDSPTAFTEVVERLLASPRYGERWGRHWLDVARYADTKDGVLMYGDARLRPYAYTYRDYVIRAFNEDLPFDQFVEQQLAADLIEPPVEPWRLAALGFLTLGRLYDNNPHDVIDDQIDVTTRGFMGLTVSCARCHDHKYDPIPTADYYSLYGVMASCEAPLELPLIASGAASEGEQETECTLYAKHFELRRFVSQQHAILSRIARERTPDYLAKIAAEPMDPLENAVFFLSLAPEDLRPTAIIRWRRFLTERATATDPVFGPWRDLLRIQETPGEDGASRFAASAGHVLDQWSKIAPGTAEGECNPLVYEALKNATLTSRRDVALVYGRVLVEALGQSNESDQTSLAGIVDSSASAKLTSSELQLAEAREQLAAILTSSASPCFIPISQTYRHMSRAEIDKYGALMGELDVIAATSPATRPRAMVVNDKPEPVEPRILVRGNASQPGRAVPRQFVAVATIGQRQPFTHGSGRLDLAHAITSRDNPLTARVIVNRVWMYHFGEPLVETPSDFGRRCAPPTHPELLDFLANEFVRGGWSLKRLHRAIMGSRAYQMASNVPSAEHAAGREIDPENRLLWRMNRQRLDFESMRDTLLFVTGSLQQRTGGRPVDVLADPNACCRTVYGLVDRQSLPAAFRAFDFAIPDQSIERRPRTMTPQQALFALNSSFATFQARAVASRPDVVGHADSGERVRAIYRDVLAREPDPDELDAALEFIAVPPDGGSTLSRWEQFAQVLLASNELMYVD